jgi:prepilin-type N-terminal cleavage/methylation domain-containing protein
MGLSFVICHLSFATKRGRAPLPIQHSAFSIQHYISPSPSLPLSPSSRARGFTLVEVLVSIAIALLLIIGIGQIFSLAQRTSGVGTTLVKMNGIQRSIQVVLDQDFHGIVTDPSDSPGLVIGSYAIPAFRNATDKLDDADGREETYNDPNMQALMQPFIISDRVHRVDRICFFSRGQYRRQTADSPNLTSSTSSTEPFI